jgi:gamma-glutamyl hercynylcysteine S-oxide synthase
MLSVPTAADRKAAFAKNRARTFQLFDIVPSEEVLQRAPLPGFRPVLWHLAHIGAFEGYWILQRALGQPSVNPRYDVIFDPIKTPRENLARLPSRSEMEAYLAQTRERVERALEESDARGDRALLEHGYVFDLVLEHERQHQETVAYLINQLALTDKRPGEAAPQGKRRYGPSEVQVPTMRVRIGGQGALFEYDNELPAHEVEVAAFRIDRDLTTNAEFAEFVEAGGYDKREWWSDDGWAWKEKEAIRLPLGWSGPPLRERRFFDEGPLREDAPVTGVSWYEADAFARSRGKRLPTEFEWETAAAWDPSSGRARLFAWGDEPFSPDRANAATTHWATTPVGSLQRGESALGLNDANGNVWEWTSSNFEGYPGFRSFPYPEYSELWFDGDHRVARGGSWFTAPEILRASFRNFFRRNFRLGFIGLRCARSV